MDASLGTQDDVGPTGPTVRDCSGRRGSLLFPRRSSSPKATLRVCRTDDGVGQLLG
jgi:hypothetical protein